MSGGGVTRMVPFRRTQVVDVSGGDQTFKTQDPPRALYIGGAGDIVLDALDDADGTQQLFAGLVAGTILPGEVKKIYQTGTTATNVVALR